MEELTCTEIDYIIGAIVKYQVCCDLHACTPYDGIDDEGWSRIVDKLDAMKYDGRRLSPHEQRTLEQSIEENRELLERLAKDD